MFEDMNSYDLACSVGGGEDSSAVLQGAGLTFICNCDLVSPKIQGKIPPDILFELKRHNVLLVNMSKQFFLFLQNINVSLNDATGEELWTTLQNTMHLVKYKTQPVSSLI